jgi:hypothetical protein
MGRRVTECSTTFYYFDRLQQPSLLLYRKVAERTPGLIVRIPVMLLLSITVPPRKEGYTT